jgi:hypothetical protein
MMGDYNLNLIVHADDHIEFDMDDPGMIQSPLMIQGESYKTCLAANLIFDIFKRVFKLSNVTDVQAIG